MPLIDYFIDPVLRGPTIGSIFMCMTAALVGVLVFLRRQSMLGESLSHAAYPGVIGGIIGAGVLSLSDGEEGLLSALVLIGAFFTAVLALLAIHYLCQKLKLKSDSALCFILAAFFGIGITLASQTQFAFSHLYRQGQMYLYGQTATMTDAHIAIYFLLFLFVLSVIVFFYKELQTVTFDRQYASSLGMPVTLIDSVIYFIIVLAIVVCIRSVGVVLMSAMLIAPAVSARQYTYKLPLIFALASLIGLVSGFLGNYFSVEGSLYLMERYNQKVTLPTGPMIVVVAFCISLISLLYSGIRRRA